MVNLSLISDSQPAAASASSISIAYSHLTYITQRKYAFNSFVLSAPLLFSNLTDHNERLPASALFCLANKSPFSSARLTATISVLWYVSQWLHNCAFHALSEAILRIHIHPFQMRFMYYRNRFFFFFPFSFCFSRSTAAKLPSTDHRRNYCGLSVCAGKKLNDIVK